MKTLQEYLEQNSTESEKEFRLVIKNDHPLTILIHPLGRDGETLDLVIKDDDFMDEKIFNDVAKNLNITD